MTASPPSGELVERYLDRLRAATTDLAPGARAELLDNIGAHLRETVPADADEASVRRELDALGSPAEIAAAARAETATPAPPADGGRAAYDVLTVLALLVGGFVVPFVGWLVGVVMLWAGPRWSAGDKWLGTLVWPGSVLLGALGWWALGAWPTVLPALGVLEFALLGGVLLVAVFIPVFVHLLRAADRGRRRGL